METAKEAFQERLCAQAEKWRRRLESIKAQAAPEQRDQLKELAILEGSARQILSEIEDSHAHPWAAAQAAYDEKWSHLAAAIEAQLTIAASEASLSHVA